MNKLSRRDFKELLTEWRINFINENSKEKKNLSDFFVFVKTKLPYIITVLTPASFESNTNTLELFTRDGNHRLEIFKRILLNLNEDENIPAIILYNGKEYENLLKESKYSFEKITSDIEKKIDDDGKRIIEEFTKKGYETIFCNSLKIAEFADKGANKPTPVINEYIEKLYREFTKGDQTKIFDTSNLISSQGSESVDVDDEDMDDYIIIP